MWCGVWKISAGECYNHSVQNNSLSQLLRVPERFKNKCFIKYCVMFIRIFSNEIVFYSYLLYLGCFIFRERRRGASTHA